MRGLVRFKARGSEWSSGFLCCSSSKLQPTTRWQFIAAEKRSAMSSRSQERIRGCGKTGLSLTLYHVGADGTARPLTHGFEHHACGDCPSTPQERAYGILLCGSCTIRIIFPDVRMS
jgi:hypothetical protein